VTVDEMLAAARSRLTRLTPREAYGEMALGAILADIRPAAQRAASGEVPGSWIVERNHLEWRFDPASDARLPWVSGYDHRVIVICVEGYTSSLAAAALQDMGLRRATDVDGGFAAWAEAGLPVAPASARTTEIAPGASAVLARGDDPPEPPVRARWQKPPLYRARGTASPGDEPPVRARSQAIVSGARARG
jgi:rhodanese-related sulfurtransferase